MSAPDLDLDAAHDEARALLPRAHAPYSRFPVAAVLVTEEGATHVGVNVENAAFGSTICAERMAIGAMIAAGDQSGIAAVVVAGHADEPLTPCGACRQVIAEFSTPATIVTSRGAVGATTTWAIGDLLPAAFGPLALAAGADRHAEQGPPTAVGGDADRVRATDGPAADTAHGRATSPTGEPE